MDGRIYVRLPDCLGSDLGLVQYDDNTSFE